jgi:UDP:flavonoid glycosyltransferase YjiC (YdhE family)
VRVLFTTTGHAGHVLPMLPFARAAADAGHDVLVATQRSRVAAVEEAGLAAAPVAEAEPAAWAPVMAELADVSREAANGRMLAEGFGGLMAGAALPDVLDLIPDWRPDLVARETFEFAGALAAERHGVPVVRIGLGLQRTERWAAAAAAPGVDRLREALGLAPDPAGEGLLATPVLTGVPAAFEAPVPRGGGPVHRFRAPRPAAAAPDPWPGDPRPLVYLTFGSVASSLPFFPGLYRDAIATLAPLDARVLVTVGRGTDTEALGPLPGNVRVATWLPQDAVLPHAAAVVCHGGHGSVLGALAHGVPVAALPLFSTDQWHLAEQIAASGAGLALTGAPRGSFASPGPDVLGALAGAVRTLLAGGTHARRAAGLGRAVAALPPVERAVPVLEAAGRRPVAC